MSLSRSIFKSLAIYLHKKHLYLTRSLNFKETGYTELESNIDYIRYATLKLCSEEIKFFKLQGNIAELGVYRGDFAKKLNALFPEKKLYLFDTFEGFSSKDVEIEVSSNYSDGQQDFSKTSVQLVLSKMKHPENCIIKKGFFPDTAEGIDDSFSFVNIDTDLYEPVFRGLEFFYPRLQPKGYIFVHDFNNDCYKGVRDAVINFCNLNGTSFVPIPDSGGTVVLTK
jgi:O-methyltransferase